MALDGRHPRSALDEELRTFESSKAGRLDDVGLLRREVAQALGAAKVRSAQRPIDIVDQVTEQGLKLRLYYPRRAEPGSHALPAFIYCHGGAFLLGSPELEDPGCVRYALACDCIVVSVDYRLAPEHRFPMGFDDCYAALEWVAQHHAVLGIDVAHIAIGGASAGGALAAGVALKARDQGGPKLVFQMLLYPVLDDRLTSPSMMSFTDTPVFARPTAEAMWRHYLGDEPTEVSSYAAPARASDLSGLPPTYIEACGLDPLRDEDITFAVGLLQAAM